jgi:hypothetical protein
MKKNLMLFFVFYFLLSCNEDQKQEQEQETEENTYSMPCSCKDDWSDHLLTCKEDLVWDYPVKLFTEEWEQIKTTEERFGICQIPEDVLSSLSTEDLTDICMEYPLLVADFLYSSRDRILDSLFNHFNGFRELFQREDVSKGLLKWYRCAMLNCSFLDSDASNIEKGWFTYKIMAAELLFSRYQSLDEAEYFEILHHLVCGYEKMFEYPESFSVYSMGFNGFSRAKIMFKINAGIIDEIPQGFENYIFTGEDNGYHEQTRIAIDSLTCCFIK